MTHAKTKARRPVPTMVIVSEADTRNVVLKTVEKFILRKEMAV